MKAAIEKIGKSGRDLTFYKKISNKRSQEPNDIRSVSAMQLPVGRLSSGSMNPS